jgi:hypothetical protein
MSSMQVSQNVERFCWNRFVKPVTPESRFLFCDFFGLVHGLTSELSPFFPVTLSCFASESNHCNRDNSIKDI